MQQPPRRALQLVGATQALREALGTPLSAVEQAQLDGRLTAVLNQADAELYITQGRQRSLAEAIEFALAADQLESRQ